jgi:hypothetical protein
MRKWLVYGAIFVAGYFAARYFPAPAQAVGAP